MKMDKRRSEGEEGRRRGHKGKVPRSNGRTVGSRRRMDDEEGMKQK
jgi:hypothetical protein